MVMQQKYMNFDVDCDKCDGYGYFWKEVEGSDKKKKEMCVACGGTGKKTLKIPKVSYMAKCPNCDEFLGMDFYVKKAMEILQGHAQDLTSWATSGRKHEFGIDAMNTRFLEVKYKGQTRIELYNTYFENYRLGNYHGYWTMTDILNITDYLEKFIERKADVVACDRCNNTGEILYERKSLSNLAPDISKLIACPKCYGRGTMAVEKKDDKKSEQ